MGVSVIGAAYRREAWPSRQWTSEKTSSGVGIGQPSPGFVRSFAGFGSEDSVEDFIVEILGQKNLAITVDRAFVLFLLHGSDSPFWKETYDLDILDARPWPGREGV